MRHQPPDEATPSKNQYPEPRRGDTIQPGAADETRSGEDRAPGVDRYEPTYRLYDNQPGVHFYALRAPSAAPGSTMGPFRALLNHPPAQTTPSKHQHSEPRRGDTIQPGAADEARSGEDRAPGLDRYEPTYRLYDNQPGAHFYALRAPSAAPGSTMGPLQGPSESTARTGNTFEEPPPRAPKGRHDTAWGC